MTPNESTNNLHDGSVRAWRATTPWYRRFSADLGLQGKLTIGFMFLMSVALGGSCWYFLNENRDAMERVVLQQATSITHTLAMASETPLGSCDVEELERIGSDLLKNKGIVATVFYDPMGRVLSASGRDPNQVWRDLEAPGREAGRRAYGVRRLETPALGRFMEVTAPVSSPARDARPEQATVTANGGAAPAVGFVRVCFSQAADEAHLSRATQMLLLIGASVSLICFPLVYGLVHRIFLPIRELVGATDRIAGGDLSTQVAVHRPDVIGTLARSFNRMADRIRGQQQQLEAANEELERANGQLAEANFQLARANVDLERTVTQRTSQLEAANRRLKIEIAEKEDFLRAVSHDLNAPLRNIAGMATMLLMKYRERFDDDIIHRLERIQKNVEVETDLIAELLELSRIKTRRQNIEAVELGEMLADVGGVFENDLRERQIRFVVDTPMPTLQCERSRLRQVFQNLVDNSIKYMGEGSPQGPGLAGVKEIHVGCVVRADEVEFYVRDTGIGIDGDDLDKVFCVFRRGRNPAVQAVSGKGVGLASVKSIVETYNGTIWVESRMGMGSTFRFTINGKFLVTPTQGQERAA